MITVPDIIAATAAHYGLKQRDIRGRHRHKLVSEARAVAMYLARKHTGASWSDLGRDFRKHHTSVIAAVERVQGWCAGPSCDTSMLVANIEAQLEEQSLNKQERWREMNEEHEARRRKPLRRDKDGNEIIAYEPRALDVAAFVRSDLECRVRTADHWGIEDAERAVVQAAIEWAHEKMKLNGGGR